MSTTSNSNNPVDTVMGNIDSAIFPEEDERQGASIHGTDITKLFPRLYSGDKSMSLHEFMDRYLAVSKSQSWTIQQQVDKLPAVTTGRAFEILTSTDVSRMTANQAWETYKSQLQNNFGITPERAFTALCNRVFNASAESLDSYGHSIRQNVNLAVPNFTAEDSNSMRRKQPVQATIHT